MQWNVETELNLIQNNGAVIYCIKNTENGKVYIGSTNHFLKRIKRHVRELTYKYHYNKHLQNAWNKHTKPFVVFILEEISDIETILNREQFYIEKYKAIDENFGYNIRNNFDFTWLSEDSIKIRQLKSKNLKKVVYAFDKNTGEFIDDFESVSDAARYFKTSSSNISRCCSGDFNFIKGCVFCYAKDYDETKSYKANKPDLKRSNETKEKMKKSFSKLRGKTVFVFKNDVLYKTFDSRAECERFFGYKKDYLRRRIGKTINGFTFKYNK